MRLWRWLGVLVLAAVAYLLFWPIDLHPVAWTPPPAPPLVSTGKLSAAERLLAGARGPEAIAFDAAGNLYTGLADGRIVRMHPDGKVEDFARTGGRPLGLAFDADGRLIVADARAGLLAVDGKGVVKTLVEGKRLGLADDVAIADTGSIFFSDATTRFGLDDVRRDVLEHNDTGRVLVYDPATGTLDVAVSGLSFANGVALAADGSYLLVDETGGYRVTRRWLTGPKVGTTEPFAENLPGFPDNITRSPRGGYWVALFSPRLAALDKMLPHPFVRKIVARLPDFVHPKPAHHGICAHLDEDGKVTALLDDDRPEAYAPITSCRERDGKLWLGSAEAEGIAVVALP